MHYDVFNGDADGICALHQWRMAYPRPEAQLVTGVKRDVQLLRYLAGVQEAEITVFDVSLESNRDFLPALLASCRIFYVDHHFAGEIPNSPNLVAHIDPHPEICTSLIVDHLLKGRFRAWAVAAAFGDNLHDAARAAAAPLDLTGQELESLRELGELLNYNGYGATVDDLHFPPQALYRAVQPYADPLAFFHESETLAVLRAGFADDMALARSQAPLVEASSGRVFRFPDAPWARRVAGVFSNEKARERREQAHALLVDNPDGTILVSVRAPLANRQGADSLCRAFPTGGGRPAAAGINALPAEQLADFLKNFTEVFSA
jgi:hypothetical protein